MKNFTKPFLPFVIVAMMGTFAFAESAASPAPALTTDTGPTVTGWFLQDGQSMALEDFLKLTPKKIKESTGKKLRLKERLALRYVQSQIKREVKKGQIAPDEEFNLDKQPFKFGLCGFFLGFLFGLIGFLISLLFKNRNVRRSALIGWGVWIVILLIAVAVA